MLPDVSWRNVSGVVRALLLAALFTLSGVAIASAAEPITASLEPAADSGARGTATITSEGEAATLSIALTGLTPNAQYLANLRAGTCAQPSASSGRLGTLTADASGAASLTTRTATASAAGATTDLTLSLLADGDHLIDIGRAGQGAVERVACGSIPKAAPSQLPRTGGPVMPVVAGALFGLSLLAFGGGLMLRRRAV